jgi:FkbM family methyltransferase
MSTARINYRGTLVRSLVEAGKFDDSPFTLVDVGVSGGLPRYWRQFEPSFAAFGFDPLQRECERLGREERNPKVKYLDYFVGADGHDALFPPDVALDPRSGWSDQPFERTSAARARDLQRTSVTRAYNDGDPDVVFTQRRTSLDAFFRQHTDARVDFVKVDTDGQDYEVLCGARELLSQHKVLGLLVEAQFHGVSHAHSNLFANVDRLLRECGFSLFDLEIHRYTRATLPGHFQSSLATSTREGQVLWGDALYLRDLSAPGYEERWNAGLPLTKILKLACLFEIFGMADCAAELLLGKKAEIHGRIDVAAALDVLAREIHPGAKSLEGVNRLFETSREKFHPQPIREFHTCFGP